jgi:outer membrane protein assembly factor BamB
VRKILFSGVLGISLLPAGFGGQWPAWRGPDGTGVSQEKNLPLNWATNQNIRWRTSLPAPGNSTPAIWGDRIFITQAIESEKLRSVLCFNRQNGNLLWKSGVKAIPDEKTYESNPPCSPSPAVDSKRVFAWFGSALCCYDFDGNELWRRDFGMPSHQWGYASSLVLYRDLCLLHFGPGESSFLIALEKKTGKTSWKFDLAPISAEAKWEDYGGDPKYSSRPGAAKVSEIAGSWATPLIVHTRKRDEMVVALPLQLIAVAPRTGRFLWNCKGPNIGAYSSAFFGDGVVALTASGLQNTAMAVRPGGNGDVTEKHRLWFSLRGDSKACISSGVIFEGHIYLANNSGIAECLDLKTGKTVWEERLTGTGARNKFWGCPVLSEGKLYVANQNADVFVLRASPKFECLTTNSIGGEPMNASLAVSDGAIFLRTEKALWCVSEGRP